MLYHLHTWAKKRRELKASRKVRPEKLGRLIHLGSTPRRGEFDFSETNPGPQKSQPHNWARPFVLCKFATQRMVAPDCGADFFGVGVGAWGCDGGRNSPRGVVTAW